jgi:hypothetical protein
MKAARPFFAPAMPEQTIPFVHVFFDSIQGGLFN